MSHTAVAVTVRARVANILTPLAGAVVPTD